LSDIPKEQQSAYQRWEMTSFGDDRASVAAARRALAEPEPVEPLAPLPLPPSEEEMNALREAGRLAGYEDGHRDGHEAGRLEALELGRIASDVALAHLATLATQFGAALAEADQLIANDVLDLALQLAKGMLKTALPVRPELILPIVREAIEYLPVLQQPALLMLNPEDAKVVRDGLGEELDKGGWRLIDDPGIERGGCKIDTASNQIDAQTTSRWQRLTAALGKDLDWLAP